MITSLKNKEIVLYSKLKLKKYRDIHNMYIVEGENIVSEARKSNVLIKTISYTDNDADLIVSKDIMSKISDTKNIPKIIGICKKNNINDMELREKIIILEDIQDPGNLGTIIRTASCFDFDVCIYGNIDIYAPKVIRSAQGSNYHTNIVRTDDITKFCEENSYEMIVTSLSDDSVNYKNLILPKKFAIIVGNEGNGVTKKIQEISKHKIKIKINNLDSLNVAIASGIIMSYFN